MRTHAHMCTPNVHVHVHVHVHAFVQILVDLAESPHCRATPSPASRLSCAPWHTITGQARPRVNESGSPPGIWMAQTHGLHFSLASSRAAREHARAAQPPLAHNEMPRAIANRIWDLLCPT